MNGKDSGLLCGIISLQGNIGGAVAVGLDRAVNGFFNDRLKERAVLHIDLVLDSTGDEGGDHSRPAQLLSPTLIPQLLNLIGNMPRHTAGDGNDPAFLGAVMFWALKRRRILIS